MNLGQRIVLVVASFFGFGLLADATLAAIAEQTYEGGWFNYAPSSGLVFSPSGASWGTTLFVCGFFLAAWTAVALWLLRSAALRRDET
jgi:hypothetical protein